MMKTKAFRSGSYRRNCAIFMSQITLGPRIHELLLLTVGDVIDYLENQ
jgi:hypothetical protein